MNLFRAPAAARAAKTLDRTLFSRTLPTSAACVRENKLISRYRKQLERTREVLALDKFDPVAAHPDAALAAQGRKCLVLKPDVQVAGLSLPSLTLHFAFSRIRWSLMTKG